MNGDTVIAQVREVVENELAEQCALNGVNPLELEYWLAGFGAIHPIINSQTGQVMAFTPSWFLGLKLRTALIGHPPLVANVPIMGVIPEDERIRAVIRDFVKNIVTERDRQFKQAMDEAATLANLRKLEH